MNIHRQILYQRVLAVFALLVCAAIASRAGGPAFVAGSGYNPGVEGQALVWASGSVAYFTDQGDLSLLLSGAQADAFVATAFSAWTSIPGVALTATQSGHLAEDVNGSNIAINPDETISAPADITSPAIGTPVGVVYDYDGTVTDALLGEGAGSSEDCFTNAVYGGPDNFSANGNIVHALVVINGVCASTNAQLPDVQYRLVRVLGRVIGLGWSQANVNVLTRQPPPISDDFAGFPVMHYEDPIACVPISACYTNAAVPKMDDMDSLARLYPGSNPQPAGRIWGGVYFTDPSGNASQQMQGVNVVARLMQFGQPSGQYVVTSVSGFAFHGNAGNIINGYVDGDGLRYDRWGSNDPSIEGFFDLGQLLIPTGQTVAEYQLSIEPLDATWSVGVESYAPTQVTPSGSFAPVVVTVANGSNAERDILMLQDEIVEAHPGTGSTYANPAALPLSGAWGSWISGYGSTDFFQFTAQSNRTASVTVTALDETSQPTETKLLPVIGIWELSDGTGDPAPAFTPSAFNSTTFATSRLDAQFGATETFRVGVADFRGDGRPDYFYQANLLYSDAVTPARLSLAGGVTTLYGIGFRPGLQVSVGSNNGSTMSASATQIGVALPPGSLDGTATIQVTDPVTGAFSQMIGALSYGALPNDLLILLQGAESATPVGAQAANPIRVRAVAADGITPVNGATIAWSANNGLQLSACNGASACSVLSDEAGEASSWLTPSIAGPSAISISLAPASYSPPQMQQASVLATSTSMDLVAMTPTRWIGQGATMAVPLTVEALNLGKPMANIAVNFLVTNGTASLSAGSATTNASGFATVTANLANPAGTVQVSGCVAPNNAPCQTFTLFTTPSSLWKLETVSGSVQVVSAGQSFQPLIVRVTDGSAAANPVMGVSVIFTTTLSTLSSSQAGQQNGGAVGGDGMPVILGSSQAQVATTSDGLASIVPSAGSVGPCEVLVVVSAGPLTAQFPMESVAAIVPQHPPNNPLAGHAAPPNPRFAPNFGSQSATEAVPQLLYAFPQYAPSDSPALDSLLGDSSGPQGARASDDSVVSGLNAGLTDKPDSPEPAKSEALDIQDPAKKNQLKPDAAKTIPANQTANQSNPVSNNSSGDKRSCHALASDEPII